MLDRELQPVRLGVRGDWGEILQALMLTYLARYNVAGAGVNPLQAYRRAFGITDIQFYARTDTELGFAVMRIPYAWGDHIVVALEGTTSSSQLWSWRYGIDGVATIAGLTGGIWGNEVLRNNSIWTRLTGNAAFMGWATARTAQITFAGHSQGASQAYLLGARWKVAHPTQTIRVRAFGCPRFAMQQFVDNYSPEIDTFSLHTTRDPVSLIPKGGCASEFGLVLTAPPFWGASFVLMPSAWVNHLGEPTEAELHDRGWTNIDAYVSLLGTSPFIPCYAPWHSMFMYRLAAMNIAFRAGGLLNLRINYLEHDDENQWQVLFRPGSVYDLSTWNVIGTPPAAFADWTPEELRLHNHPAAQPNLPPVDRDTGPGESGGGETDWGVVPNVDSLRRRRAQHTPMVGV